MNAPSQLYELQIKFKSLITNPEGLEVALQDSSLDWIKDNPPLSQKERLDIYSEGYFLRLVNSMERCYPSFSKFVGYDRFRYFVSHYYEKYPSHTPLIQETGDSFSKFLLDFYPEEPWLEEYAKLDLNFYESLHTEEYVPNLNNNIQVKEDEQEKALVLLNPTIRLELCNWESFSSCLNDKPQKSNYYQITWKHKFNMHSEIYSIPQGKLLEILLDNPNISSACELWNESYQENESIFAEWFKSWFEKGIILSLKS